MEFFAPLQFRKLLVVTGLLVSWTAQAVSPAVESTDAVVQHRGTLVAATATGLYRWSDPGWSLWYPWTLRAQGPARPQSPETQETLERQRAFDELFEELLPVYGEAEAEAQTEDLLGYTRPLPPLVPVEETEDTFNLHPTVVQNLTSHGSDVWACTTQGVYQVGLSSRHHLDLGRVCFDLVVGSGLLVIATDRGVFRKRPGEPFQRLIQELPGALVGLALRQNRIFAATSQGVFEIESRAIRRSGAILDGFGRLGDRLVGVTEGRILWIGDSGRARPSGEILDGNFVRADDGQLLVTSEGVWRWEKDRLARLAVPIGSHQIRDALVRGGLWLATAEGVIQPPKEEAPLSSLGVILDAREAKVWTQRLIDSYGRRGLSLEPMASRPKLSRWIPDLSLSFTTDTRRGLGVLDLERIADEFDVELDDLEELDEDRRQDFIDQDWRLLIGLTWRPALSFGDRVRNQAGVRSMILQERRRLARRTSKLLVAHLATERSMILRPPRSLRAAVMRILKQDEQRALLEGLLQQEFP